MNLTLSENLLYLAGALLAIAMDWVPVLRDRYDQLTPGQKRFWMAVFLVVAAITIFSAECAGLTTNGLTCDTSGAMSLVVPLLVAVAINQGIHQISKPS